MVGNALLIGNSDGIGLAATRALLLRGWKVTGISRSKSPLVDDSYTHFLANVESDDYLDILNLIIKRDVPIDLCIYFAGIGELLNIAEMEREENVLNVNFLCMVRTVSRVIPSMVSNRNGHFIGLSSVADEVLSPEAPSYSASKAGVSNYLESLALALREKGVCVSNVRFGFVDTKMVKSSVKPFMMTVDTAVGHLLNCISKRPIRYTAPKRIIPLVKLRNWMLRLMVMIK